MSAFTLYKFVKPQISYESYLDQLSVKNTKRLADSDSNPVSVLLLVDTKIMITINSVKCVI